MNEPSPRRVAWYYALSSSNLRAALLACDLGPLEPVEFGGERFWRATTGDAPRFRHTDRSVQALYQRGLVTMFVDAGLCKLRLTDLGREGLQWLRVGPDKRRPRKLATYIRRS